MSCLLRQFGTRVFLFRFAQTITSSSFQNPYPFRIHSSVVSFWSLCDTSHIFKSPSIPYLSSLLIHLHYLFPTCSLLVPYLFPLSPHTALLVPYLFPTCSPYHLTPHYLFPTCSPYHFTLHYLFPTCSPSSFFISSSKFKPFSVNWYS